MFQRSILLMFLGVQRKVVTEWQVLDKSTNWTQINKLVPLSSYFFSERNLCQIWALTQQTASGSPAY